MNNQIDTNKWNDFTKTKEVTNDEFLAAWLEECEKDSSAQPNIIEVKKDSPSVDLKEIRRIKRLEESAKKISENKLITQSENKLSATEVPIILPVEMLISDNPTKNEITRIIGNLSATNAKLSSDNPTKNEKKEENITNASGVPFRHTPITNVSFSKSEDIRRDPISKIIGTRLSINVPKGFPELIETILRHENVSACPLDHTSDHTSKWAGPVSFEKNINGKFNLEHTKDTLCLFLDTINEYFQTSFEKEGFHEIPAKVFFKISPRYSFYLKWLIKNKFILCDGTWSDPKIQNGVSFSKGYRFPDSVTDLETYEIKNKKVARLLEKPLAAPYTPPEYEASKDIAKNKISTIRLPDDAYEIIRNYGETRMENGKFKPWEPIELKNEIAKLDKFKDLEVLKSTFSRRNPGRMFSIFTSLPKVIREKLLFGEESLAELDIRAAQPAILYSIYSSHLVPDDMKDQKEKEISILGKLFTTKSEKFGIKMDFYNYLVWEIIRKFKGEKGIKEYAESSLDEKKLKRDWMKVQIMVMFFSSSDKKPNFQIHKLFSQIFPVLTQLIDGYSTSNKKEDQLWYRLQKMESDIVIDGVCPRIAEMGIDFFSVHDSINFPSSKLESVEIIWKEELKKAGVLQPLT